MLLDWLDNANEASILLHGDDQAAMHISKNPVDGTYHLIRRTGLYSDSKYSIGSVIHVLAELSTYQLLSTTKFQCISAKTQSAT